MGLLAYGRIMGSFLSVGLCVGALGTGALALGGAACAAGTPDTSATNPGPVEPASGSGGDPSSGVGGGDMGGMGGEDVGQGGGGGAEDPCAMGCAEGFWDIDDNPLTGECGCEYACDKVSDDDPIDADFEDDNCDGSDGVVEECVYVSQSLGSETGAGTREDPIDTIDGGIDKAIAELVPAVCVSGETYDGPVNVVSGINLYGGFSQQDADFPFRRSALAVSKIKAKGTVFLAEAIEQETHIAGFTIEADTPDVYGESTYGVRHTGGMATLYVRYNVIDAAVGQDGIDGASGLPHADDKAPNGPKGGDGKSDGDNTPNYGAAPICTEVGGRGGSGGYASKGEAGKQGTGSTTVGTGGDAASFCFGDGDAGTMGASHNTDGLPGDEGDGGAAIGTIADGMYFPADATSGTIGNNGKGASGGGGGGGGVSSFVCNKDTGGGGGAGGCGGLGGNFGAGAQGGGGSFGVFSAAGDIVVEGNDITAQGGGAGGMGGDGADGQYGGDGGGGGPGKDDSGPGGPGGSGSDGGAGGPGGGGGGGPSACLAYSTSATFTFQSQVGCVVGPPGAGGDGGGNTQGGNGGDGGIGKSGTTLQI